MKKLNVMTGWREYVFIVMVILINCFIFQGRIERYTEITGNLIVPSMGDYFLDFFKGIHPFFLERGEKKFEIPGLWSLYYIFFFCIQGLTISRISRNKYQFLIRSSGRVAWWNQVRVTLFLEVSIFYAISYATIFLFCIVNHIIWEWPNANIQLLFNQLDIQYLTSLQILVLTVMMPIIGTVTMLYIQYLVSLKWSILAGILGSITCIVVSCFYCKWGLLGNYMMVIRNTNLFLEKRSIAKGFLYCLIVCLSCTLVGKRLIRKKDFFN